MNPLEMASQYYGEGLNILPSNFPKKVERKLKKKKKQKKEKKPKDEPRVFLGEWVEDGVESSSSDESIKSTTFRTNEGVPSSSNTCHMAKGMDSNISDDDSDSPSIKDILDLVHEHPRIIRKQSREIKNLNASLAINYEDLLCKFKLLSKEHEELKSKFESINNTNDFLEMKQSTHNTNSNSKVDASTSCFDLIDESNPCHKKRL